MDPQERALIAAVRAAPDADEPRVVYADWLQQRGEPRGELVMLQLEIAAGRGTPAIEAREQELRAQHGQRWLAELGLAPGEGRFERGFVETVGLVDATVARLMAVVASVADAGPLRTLSFRGADGADGRLSSSALATLFEAPWLAHLTTLELKHCQLDTAAIEQIAHANPRLTALALDDNPIEDDAVEILARSPIAQRLQVFSYERCGLAARGVDAIAAGFTQLVALDISETGLFVDHLVGLGKMSPTLQALVIRRNALGGDFLGLLARRTQLSLLHLGLAGNIIEDGYHWLRDARHLDRLCVLDVNENTHGDDGVVDLVRNTRSMRFMKLGLAANFIGERGVDQLLAAPQLADVEELDLRNNGLSEAARARLVARFGPRVLVEPQAS